MEYSIKPPDDSAFGRARTYFTEYDPVVQNWYHGGFTPSQLIEKIKALSLVHDSITVAAAHMVRSETTFAQLRENRRLLEEGVIVPAMNADFNSFEEMVDQKTSLDRYGDPWIPDGRLSETDLVERAKFFDQHSRLVMGWDIEDMRGTFKESLLRDLDDPDSRIRSKLAGTDIEELRQKIKSATPFSRKNILDVTATLSRSERAVLADYMNASYHLAGSTIHRASVNVHSDERAVLGDKFRRGIDASFDGADGRERFLEKYQVSPEYLNREVPFRAHLDVMDIDLGELRQLEIDDILDVRDAQVTRKYSDRLLEVLEDYDTPPQLLQNSDLQRDLREEIRKYRNAEKRRIERTKTALRTSVYASGIGAYVAGAQEFGFALHVMDPVIRRLIDRVPTLVGSDFLAFEQKLTETVDSDDTISTT